jgi:hypothetical protein
MIDKFLLEVIAIPQSAVRPSLYRPGVVFLELESCCSRNKVFGDKIELNLNFPKTIKDRRSDHTTLAVRPPAPGSAGSVKNRSSTGAKLKNLRRVLREWHKQNPNLASSIANTKELILMIDTFEEFRDPSLEWNFRDVVKQHLEMLLQQQNAYWKQRGRGH